MIKSKKIYSRSKQSQEEIENNSSFSANGFIYARQSSGDEATSESVELQIEKCKILALQEKINVVGISKDLNTSGKTYPTGAEEIAKLDISFQTWYKEQSGHKMFRDGLGEVLKNLDKIDFIIVYDITRLYRPINGSHLESYINQLLIFHKVKVLTVNNGVLDVGSFNDSIVTALQNRINHEHIALCRKKSIAAMNKLRDSGIYCNGGKAFGLKYIGNKEFTIEERKAEAIKRIFEMVIAYRPYLQIINYLNTHYKDCFKKCCYASNIYHIVSNPIYAGYMYNTNHELIRNIQMEGKEIISFEMWKKAQEIMAQKRKQPNKAKYHWLPFSGLLIDGPTGTKLVSGFDRGKLFYYANIKNLDKSIETGGLVSIDVEKQQYSGLYSAIIPFLTLAFINRVEKAETFQKKKQELEKFQIELFNMREKEKEFSNLFLKGLIDRDTFEDALKSHQERKSELNNLIAELAAYKDEDKDKLLFAQWTEFNQLIHNDLSKSQFEILLKESIKRITIFKTYIVIDTVYGAVTLPRFLVTNKKQFPKWDIELEEIESKKYAKFDLRRTLIKVFFKLPSAYQDDSTQTLIGKFKNIQFWTIGKN